MWEVENYNSRPRDMINHVLNEIQKKSIVFNEHDLNKILKITLHLSLWLKEINIITNQIEYIIDAVMPFVDKIEDDFNILKPFLNDDDLKTTFEKSPSTTSNVNLRLNIAAKHLNV